jgi:hypothetical protein
MGMYLYSRILQRGYRTYRFQSINKTTVIQRTMKWREPALRPAVELRLASEINQLLLENMKAYMKTR